MHYKIDRSSKPRHQVDVHKPKNELITKGAAKPGEVMLGLSKANLGFEQKLSSWSIPSGRTERGKWRTT